MVTMEIPTSGTAMTWEEFDALGEIRAEHIDGRIVTEPNPDRIHQRCRRLMANLLEPTLRPGFQVVHAWSWKPGRDEFVPDVLVHAETDEDVRYTGIPVLVVEVLGRQPVIDLWKASRYVAYGLERCWILDPGRRELLVFGRQDGVWEHLQTVGREPIEVDFGAGVARIDLAAIIPKE